MEETMKCIKNLKTNSIIRVTDEQAYQAVGSKWQYVSKSEWKSSTRTPKSEEPVVESTKTISDSIIKGYEGKIHTQKQYNCRRK